MTILLKSYWLNTHSLQQMAHDLLLRGHAGPLSTAWGRPGGAPS